MERDTVGQSREAIRQALLMLIAGLESVIQTNERLAQEPAHAESAARRIAEAEVELQQAHEELTALEAGGWPTRD